MTKAKVSEADNYPRIYGMSVGSRVGFFFFGIFISFAGYLFLNGVHYSSIDELVGYNGMALLMGLVTFLMGLCGILLALSDLQVKLFEDAVEVRNIFYTRRLRHEDILGIRYGRNKDNGMVGWVLEPKAIQAKCVGFLNNLKLEGDSKQSLMLKDDPVFNKWIAHFPDLDKTDLRKSRDEIKNEQQSDSIEGDSGCFTLNAASIILMLWAIMIPEPYVVLAPLLSALPLFALYKSFASKGFVHLWDIKNDAHPSLGFAFMSPGFALCIANPSIFTVENGEHMLVLAILCGIFLTGITLRADTSSTSKKIRFAGFFVMLCIYGHGVTAYTNTLFDKVNPVIDRLTVVDKQTHSGRKSVSHWLYLSDDPSQEHSVTFIFYRKVNIGQEICKTNHHGWLGIDWYDLNICKS